MATKFLRVDIQSNGQCCMTGITVAFEDTETDFELAKAKALGEIVRELSRYGLHEALGGLGIKPADPFVVVNGERWGRKE